MNLVFSSLHYGKESYWQKAKCVLNVHYNLEPHLLLCGSHLVTSNTTGVSGGEGGGGGGLRVLEHPPRHGFGITS